MTWLHCELGLSCRSSIGDGRLIVGALSGLAEFLTPFDHEAGKEEIQSGKEL